MNQSQYQTPIAGGIATRLPQNPQDAGALENWRIDRVSGGWCSRVGYEPYRVGHSSWEPFSTTGPVYGLHVAQQLGGGARQAVLFEADGKLQYYYDAVGSTPALRTLASGRHIPTPTEAGPWFTDTPHGTIVTNGVDRPVIVNPWPLGDFAESATAITRCIRPFGFATLPGAPEALKVNPMPAPVAGNYNPTVQSAVTLWAMANPLAIADGGRWGLGLSGNTGASAAAGDSKSVFSYAVSFISSTGSEGPVSELGTIAWGLPINAQGARHCVAVRLPIGPEGTVARKLYRTKNYSDDGLQPGETTLYELEVIRNNAEDLYFDAIRTADLRLPREEIATGPLPAPRARFSALFAGSLWLDGGTADGLSLYYSAPGLIEQFGAANYIQLAAEGGAVTGLFGAYTRLVVFRERGIDVVSGTYSTGFEVTTISNSVTCVSPHTIQAVPGLGLVFLAKDGIYALTGGLEGGAIADVLNLTMGQDELIQRMTPDCLPKAVGIFSAAAREYQVWYPAQGNDRPNRGIVLHLDRLGLIDAQGLSAWSERSGFPVGAIATRADGTIIFGHHTGAEAGGTDSQRGLFVQSGKRARGSVISDDVMVWNPAPTSTYRSAWWAAGDPQLQKQITYVTIWVMTTGDASITMRHYKDFSLTPVLERTYLAQPPDADVLPTMDKTLLGSTEYRTERLVPLRYSVAHMSAAWFCFEIETTADIIIVGHEYEFTTKGTKVVMGRRA